MSEHGTVTGAGIGACVIGGIALGIGVGVRVGTEVCKKVGEQVKGIGSFYAEGTTCLFSPRVISNMDISRIETNVKSIIPLNNLNINSYEKEKIWDIIASERFLKKHGYGQIDLNFEKNVTAYPQNLSSSEIDKVLKEVTKKKEGFLYEKENRWKSAAGLLVEAAIKDTGEFRDIRNIGGKNVFFEGDAYGKKLIVEVRDKGTITYKTEGYTGNECVKVVDKFLIELKKYFNLEDGNVRINREREDRIGSSSWNRERE